jgi:hypothetical protein
MKRRIGALAVAGLLVFGAAGCGNESPHQKWVDCVMNVAAQHHVAPWDTTPPQSAIDDAMVQCPEPN